MLELANTIATHPVVGLVALMSLAAAVGFLMFFWGFTGYMLAHGDIEHQMHAREQMIQGLSIFFAVIAAWEVFRFLAALWLGEPASGFSVFVSSVAAIVVAFLLLKKLWKATGGGAAGGGH